MDKHFLDAEIIGREEETEEIHLIVIIRGGRETFFSEIIYVHSAHKKDHNILNLRLQAKQN